MAPVKVFGEVSGMPQRSHPRPPLAADALPRGDRDAQWTNLGDWRGTTDYVTAAAALATRVGNAARLGADDVVVDYACGYGDSLRLWIERFGVRRVVGVEPDPAVCAHARARVAAWGLTARIQVTEGYAESLPPRRADPDATAVVCVDAAYHFATRHAWWAMVAADLPVGGRIATADLLCAPGARPSLALRAAAAAMRIPAANLVDVGALHQTLAALPLGDVEIAACGADVLDGFVRHMPAQGLAVGITRLALRTLRARGLVEYAIVAARRAPAAHAR